MLCSVGVALLAAALVFGLWYPYPYRELSGGRELFLLIVAVDVVCGPLLTMVIFNPAKPRAELWRDLGLVALIQLGALGYGLHTVWQARPLFLVQEVDRFKVIAGPMLDGAAIAGLPAALQPHWWKGPLTVAIREPKDAQERQKVMFESVQGGRDYGERAEFYLPYEGSGALKSLNRAKPLSVFLQKQPSQQHAAQKLAAEKGADMAQWLYLPVVARQDWVAVLNQQGQIQGFLQGDGF
ncbi:Fimbrial assembly protein FimB [Polaromonas sp. CG9_12]|nr:Fimbrial assembly protein FimB [Polaromonas sp. CG9_12]